MLADLRAAVRQLRRAPGHALAVVLVLALGIGGTTAMFGVVDAVLLRPLPLADPARVVTLGAAVRGEPQGGSPGLLTAWGEATRSLAAVAALQEREFTRVGGGAAERLDGAAVSGGFFQTLGARTALGRAVLAADDRPGADPVAVLSDRLWRRAFGADPRAVGRVVRLDGTDHTVVGVLPPSFADVAGERDVFVPLALPPSQRANYTPYLTLVGRLAPGVTPADAARELDAVTARLGSGAYLNDAPQRAVVTPLDEELTAAARRPLWLLLGGMLAVLGVACANAAALVLARGVGRERERAVRAALGAGRARLAREAAAELAVLGAAATACAVAVAAAGVRVLAAAIPAGVPRAGAAALDLRALAAAVALGIGATAVCAVAPALAGRRLDVQAALRGARGATDRRGDGWRRLLVGAEVAGALVLLAGAGLLLRSAAAMGRVRPGFDTAGVLTARLALPVRDYPELPAALRGYASVLDAARRQPEVAAAALVSRVPLGGSGASVDLFPAGAPAGRAAAVNAGLRVTSDGYFRSMGVPLLAGRDLRAADGRDAPPVVVVNATLARRLGAPTPQAAVGMRVRSDNGAFADSAGRPRLLEVVGVAGDVRDGGLRGDVLPEFYAPMAQVSEEPWDYWIGREMVLVARARGGAALGATPDDGAPGAAALAPALRRAAAAVDARVPLYDVRTTGERLRGAVAVERFATRLVALLGAFGLALAALGVYGLVAHAAAARAREVGVRLALGSTPARAVRFVAAKCLTPVAAGLLAGTAGAVFVGRAAAGFLFGVAPLDPVAFAGAVLVLAAVAAAAAYGPARRTARIDPGAAMRPE